MSGPELVYSLIVMPGGAWSSSQGLVFAALMVSIGILATSRPLLTLFVLFGGPAWSLLSLGDAFGGRTFLVVVVALGLLLLEHQLRATEWPEVFSWAFELQGVLAIGVAWGWFVVGSTPQGVVLDLGPVAPALLLPLFAAILVHTLLFRARARVWRLLRDIGMLGIATLAETLLVGTVAVVLLFAPFLALGAAGIGAMPVVLVAVGVHGVVRLIDRQFRYPCPSCGGPARVEASRCPHCGAPIGVRRPLG
ncbi:MAG: zinc ribbon domain-containing protein [Myxococcota bacterium]